MFKKFFRYLILGLGLYALIATLVIVFYKDDPQAKCHVSTEGFKILAEKIQAINKPVIVLVEGGYCIEKLNENLQAFISGFTAEKIINNK